MIAVASEFVVGARDVPIGVNCHGPFESKTDKVYAVANRIVVGGEGGERPENRGS